MPTPPRTAASTVRQGLTAARAAVLELIAAAPGWVGGVLAGLQAALFSMALVLIPVWVMAAASTTPAAWSESTGLATRVWLTAFRVPWAVEGVPITIMPLGVTALTALMLAQLARRFASATWAAGGASVAAFACTVGVAAASAWSGQDDGGAKVSRAVVVAVLIAVPAVAWGLLRKRGATFAWLPTAPAPLRLAVRAGTAMGAGALALAGIVGAVGAVAHRHAIAESATALGSGQVDGIALAFAEALYGPTLAVWLTAWLAGAGFAVGDHVVASGAVAGQGVPGIPILEALPDRGAGWLGALAVAGVGAVAVAALWRAAPGGLRGVAVWVGAAGLAGIGIGVASAAARGAMGPGALQVAGSDPVVAGLLVAAELASGALVAAVAAWGLDRASVGLSQRRSHSSPQASPRTRSGTVRHPPA